VLLELVSEVSEFGGRWVEGVSSGSVARWERVGIVSGNSGWE
jgi:hypothetical protein